MFKFYTISLQLVLLGVLMYEGGLRAQEREASSVKIVGQRGYAITAILQLPGYQFKNISLTDLTEILNKTLIDSNVEKSRDRVSVIFQGKDGAKIRNISVKKDGSLLDFLVNIAFEFNEPITVGDSAIVIGE